MIDAHHHLWVDHGHTGFPYLVEDLRADVAAFGTHRL